MHCFLYILFALIFDLDYFLLTVSAEDKLDEV